jgi:PAS domain S-box-containing protein
MITALAPLLDQQAWMLAQELGLNRAMVDRILQEQRAILDVLATRYDALDEAVVCSEIPFAEIDGDGLVVYANETFQELIPNPEGRSFTSLFGAREPHVAEALRSGGNTSLRVDVRADGAQRHVRLEVGPLRDENTGLGSYALLLDQTAERSRLNALQDGVLRTDLEGYIRFANERAAESLGFDPAELLGAGLGSVLLAETDEESDPILRWQAAESGFAEFVRLRLKDGRIVPARLSGTPYIEGSNRSAGLLIVFAPLVEDLARQELKRILLEEEDPQRIIQAALTAIGTVIPFDMASFGIYDDQCSFWRALAIVPTPDWEWSTRWFPINALTKAWLEKGLTWDNKLTDWINHNNPEANLDPVTRAILERKFTSMLVLPIREVGGFRSAVSLVSKSHNYCAADLRTLQNLGVEEVLQAADAALERARMRAVRILKDELNKAQSPRLLAEKLAKGAVNIYGWGYVGVFRVDLEKRQFTLMAEEASERLLLVQPEGSPPYAQDIAMGMLGKCLEKKSVLIVNDVDGDRETHGFIKTAPGQRSAMTVPLFLNGRIEMILDLESTERNSFVGPDQEAARGLAADCEQIFSARWRQVIELALMNRIEQAAVIVNAGGTITEMNIAAEKMLGRAHGEPLAMFGARELDRKILGQSGKDLQPRIDLRLSVSAGSGLPPAEVATRAERTPLLDDYGYQLWLFTSLAEQSRTIDWEFLEETVTSVAQQTRAPLLVADGLLRGALSLLQQPRLAEEGAQLLRQAANALLKADLTFERLSERLTIRQPPADAPTPFEVRSVLYHEVDALCRSDDDLPSGEGAIQVTDEISPNIDLLMTGWPERLGFAFRSALSSLLLQRIGSDDRVEVTIASDRPERVVVRMFATGMSPIAAEATVPIQQSQERARQLTRRASEAIEAAVKQHGGTLREVEGSVYVFSLPLIRLETT